jgi:hypothetical protein
VDHSLFMAVMMVLTSERAEKCPEVTPTTFSPPIFAGTASFSMFHVSTSPHFAIIEGVFI